MIRNLRIDWTRKAEGWQEADMVTNPSALADIKARLADGRLPIYVSTEPDPCSYFTGSQARPQYFVAKRANGWFLVNTEGYDYARYIAALPAELFTEAK